MQEKAYSRHSSRMTVLALLLLLLLLLFNVQPMSAHPPSNMELEYDVDEQTLSVTVTHQIPGPGNHYVKRIEIRKNGGLELSEDYTTQPTRSTFTYVYAVTARDGDVLEAKAYCSLFGDISRQITVSAPSPVTPRPTPTAEAATPLAAPVSTPSPSPSPAAQTPGFEVLFGLMSIGAARYAVKRKC